MAIFNKIISTTQKMIQKYGEEVVWRQYVSEITDINKPWIVSQNGSYVDTKVHIVFIPLEKMLRYDIDTVNTQGHVRGLMGNVSFTPVLRDVVIRGSKQFNIQDIEILSPNGQIILYTIGFMV